MGVSGSQREKEYVAKGKREVWMERKMKGNQDEKPS